MKINGLANASGLPPNIVEQLMEVEMIPIRTIEGRKSNTEAKLALVQDLDTKVRSIRDSIGELANSRGFSDMKLISGDENIIQGSVDPLTATTGSWNIEVIELAQKSSALSNGFPDKDTSEIGVGYLRFETPEGQKEVYIGGDNSTLSGVAQTINNAGLGLQASVITDKTDPENPFRLMISGVGVGDESKVSFPKVYMLDGDMDFYFDGAKEAKNGKVKIDGFELEIGENTLEDVIPGIVLDLKQSAPGKTINVSVKEDREVVVGKVKTFVDSMNEVLGFIQKQNALNEKSDTTKTLGGDQMLRTIEYRLRNMIQTPVLGTETNLQNLSQIGISFNRQGLLEFNQEKFNSILAKDPVSVQKFLAGDGAAVGFIPRLRSTVGNLMDNSFGPIANKRRSLQSEIDRSDQRIDSLERNLENKERTLRRKFASLEENMSRLQGQGAILQARLGGGGK